MNAVDRSGASAFLTRTMERYKPKEPLPNNFYEKLGRNFTAKQNVSKIEEKLPFWHFCVFLVKSNSRPPTRRIRAENFWSNPNFAQSTFDFLVKEHYNRDKRL